MSEENIILPENHTQVCVWQGTVIKDEEIDDFESWIKTEFGTRIKYLETIITKADETGPGGRSDVFFSVHDDDLEIFCMPKIRINARWIEDVLSVINKGKRLYPARVQAYQSWNADDDTEEEKANNTHQIKRKCNHE